jgi:hypothetical protein
VETRVGNYTLLFASQNRQLPPIWGVNLPKRLAASVSPTPGPFLDSQFRWGSDYGEYNDANTAPALIVRSGPAEFGVYLLWIDFLSPNREKLRPH